MTTQNAFNEAIAALNEVRFPTGSGMFPAPGYPGLGELISMALSGDPLLATNNILVGNAAGQAADVTMSGEASIVASGAVTLSNAAVIGKILTGFAAGAGSVTAADSILSALQKIAANCGRYRCLNVVASATTSDDNNVDGLSSALALAIDLRTSIVTHMMSIGAGAHASADPFSWAQIDVLATAAWVGAADGLITVVNTTGLAVDDLVYVDNNPVLGTTPVVGYVASIDTTTPGAHIVHITVAAGGLGGDVDFTGFTTVLGAHLLRSVDEKPADPTNLASLLTFTGILMAGYVLHDNDSELGAAWLYHIAQEAGDHSLASIVPPATLAEAITKLNDLQTKFNAHVADIVTHTAAVGASAAAAAVNGNTVTIPEGESLVGDEVQWAVLDGGAGPKVGVTATAGTGVITFEFDAPPVSDVVLSYSLFRAN